MRLRQLILLGAFLNLWTVGCSTIEKLGSYRNSALSNQNPAPDSMSPNVPDNGNIVDPTYMQSQADYHFALAEALSLDGESSRAIEEYKLTLIYDTDSHLVRRRLATEYVKLGLYSEAIEQAEIAASADPTNTETFLILGSLYTSLKMYSEAIKQYEKVLQLDAENDEAPMFIAAIYSERKQYALAEEYLLSLTKNAKVKSKHHRYFYFLGRVYIEEGKDAYEKAEQAFLQSVNLKPKNLDAVMALAKLYKYTDRSEQAVNLVESFQRRFGPDRKSADFLSRHYLEQDPPTKDSYQRAIKQLEYIEEYDPSDLNVKTRVALLLMELEKYSQAIVKLEQILLQAPDSDNILFYLGYGYEALDKYKDAVEKYRQISPSSSYFADAVIHAAYLLKQMNETDEAFALVDQSIKSRSNVPQFYAYYASLLDEKKMYSKAIDVLEQAIEKFNTHVQLNFFLGSMYDRIGDKEQTIKQMQRVIALDDSHVQALNYLAYTYADLGRNLEYAEQLVNRALKIKPNDGFILDTMGWVLYKQGRLKDAINFLEAAHKVQIDESIIAEHLGDAYYRYQLTEKAKSMYIKAIQVEQDVTKVEKIRQKIGAIDEYLSNQKTRLPASLAPMPTKSPKN